MTGVALNSQLDGIDSSYQVWGRHIALLGADLGSIPSAPSVPRNCTVSGIRVRSQK